MTSYALSRVPMKPLYNTNIKIFISPLSMLYLKKVLLIRLKNCVFYIIYKLKLPLHVSFEGHKDSFNLYSFILKNSFVDLDELYS